MAIRELDESSINWGGLAGMRLVNDPSDPLPARLLGGLSADEFLAGHLDDVFDPVAAELGLLTDSSSSVQTLAWSLRDPSSSFYNEVLDNIFAVPGPALPADELITVPRLVNQTVTSRCFQAASTSDHVVSTEHEIVSKVLYIMFLVSHLILI